MSNNQLKFEGLAELRAALRNLPKALRDEASEIIQETAHEAAVAIVQNYPRRTGTLKNSVKVKRLSTAAFVAGAQVVNAAPHAAIFEHGTQARHTALGANRGAMPPGRVFVPVVVRQRRRMNQKLKAIVERQGFVVSGE